MAMSTDRDRGSTPIPATGAGGSHKIVKYAAVTAAKITVAVPAGAMFIHSIQLVSTAGFYTGANDTLDNTGDGNVWSLVAATPINNLPCAHFTNVYVHEPSAAAGVGIVQVIFEMGEGSVPTS